MPMLAALTDIGNAERFVQQHGDEVRYVPTWKSWVTFDGRRWRRDVTCDVERRAQLTVRSIWKEANDDEDDKATRKEIRAWAEKSENVTRLRALVEAARSKPGLAVQPDAFDTAPMLFVCANGTLDFESGQLREHRASDFLTRSVGIPYEPDAAAPTWRAFLHRIFDGNQDLIAYVQRAVGYSLTGDVREQCFHILHGTGANGKSTFLEVLAHILGDYAVQADFATFIERQTTDAPRNDVARLAGARLVRSEEVGEGKRFNESLIKALTGEIKISARFLWSEAFEFMPTFKIWLAANHKPTIRGVDPAIWRRVRLVPFEVTIPDHEKDDMLRAKLFAEAPGILAWAVRGCREWAEYGLQPPSVVAAATQDYKSESDVLGAFLDDCCELGGEFSAKSSDLYASYRKWALLGGEYVLSQTAFGRRIDERGFASVKNGVKYRSGLRLRDHFPANGSTDSYGQLRTDDGQLFSSGNHYEN